MIQMEFIYRMFAVENIYDLIMMRNTFLLSIALICTMVQGVWAQTPTPTSIGLIDDGRGKR